MVIGKTMNRCSRAQIQLMERSAERAGVPKGGRVLDIGCGVGGSGLWPAAQFDCEVTGITISPVQARMAASKAKARGLAARVRFEVLDANEWQPQPSSVDIIWIMESSEHFRDKPGFFERCAAALKPGGVLAVCVWLRRDGPLRVEEQPLVLTIAEAMLSASLGSLSDYQRWMRSAGLTSLRPRTSHVMSRPPGAHCAQDRRQGRCPFFWPFH